MTVLETIRGKLIFFAAFTCLLFLLVIFINISSMEKMTASAKIMHTDYIPIIEAAHFASSALRDGQEILYEASEEVRQPQDYDKLRKFESKFKKTMIDFDMYSTAMIFGSQSEEFENSSGGLNNAMWKRSKIDEKMIVKKAPERVRILLLEIENDYKQYSRIVLTSIREQKKVLRKALIGQEVNMAEYTAKTKESNDEAKKLMEKISLHINQINDELGIYLSDSVHLIESRNQRAQGTTVIFSVFLLGFVILFSLYFPYRNIVVPINALIKSVGSIGKGQWEKHIEPTATGEINQLVLAFNEMIDNLKKIAVSRNTLAQEVEQRKKAQGELDATNQQLRANEQHLRALNQQLQANEQQLKAANIQLKQATHQLVQAEKNTALGELTAGIAHELNQPLNVIKIICQSISRDIEKGKFDLESTKEDLPEILEQVNKVARIIEHMRAFTQIANQETNEEFDINQSILNPLNFIEQQLKDRNIRINKLFTHGLPRIYGNRGQVEQAIWHILTNARNALDSTPKNSKFIDLKTYLSQDSRSVILEIKDNGPGIPEEARLKIFQPFFTNKNALAPDGRPVKGKGLGLSIASHMIKEQGGAIELESQPGEGSTFKIILPLKDKMKVFKKG